jgi:hypothetical protein
MTDFSDEENDQCERSTDVEDEVDPQVRRWQERQTHEQPTQWGLPSADD